MAFGSKASKAKMRHSRIPPTHTRYCFIGITVRTPFPFHSARRHLLADALQGLSVLGLKKLRAFAHAREPGIPAHAAGSNVRRFPCMVSGDRRISVTRPPDIFLSARDRKLLGGRRCIGLDTLRQVRRR